MKPLFAILCAISLALGAALPSANAECMDIDVRVDPKVINQESPGKFIILHAEIPYVVVVEDSVEVIIENKSYEPGHIDEDQHGDLYVTSDREPLKDQDLDPGEYIVVLKGLAIINGYETIFCGSDQVFVLERR